jgi:hypothetical protein
VSLLAQSDGEDFAVSAQTLNRVEQLTLALPERNRTAVQRKLNGLEGRPRQMIFEMFETFQSGADRNDMRLIVTTVSLFDDLQALMAFIRTGAFPASGQLPDVISHWERTIKATPEIAQRLGLNGRRGPPAKAARGFDGGTDQPVNSIQTDIAHLGDDRVWD